MHAWRFVATLAALVSLGCAAFRQPTAPPTSPWPPAAAASKKSIRVSLAANVAIADSAPVDAPPAMVSRWRTWTEATYRDSALFSAVVAEDMPSDVRSEIRVVDSGDFRRWMAIVCGVTLFLFPAKATDHFTLHTEFKNAKGEVLATIEKSESVDSWIGLFLIVVTPFRWPGREVGDLVTELNRATLAEAHAQGIF